MEDVERTDEDASTVTATVVEVVEVDSLGEAHTAAGIIVEVGGTPSHASPGDDLLEVERPLLSHGVSDSRGILERIVDTVLHDDNEHIDRRSGPSI